MTQPMTEQTFEKLTYFLKGDTNALNLCIDLLFVAHYADDLYDGDVERTKEDAKIAFRKVFVDMPLNPFFQAFSQQLTTLTSSAYMMWVDSINLEKGNDEDKFKCFHIRNSLLNVIHHCIFLLGGPEWIETVGPDFWKTFGPPLSKWYEFKDE